MNKRNVILTHELESQAEFVLGFCVAGAYVMFVKSVGHMLRSEPLWPVEHMWADWLDPSHVFLRAQKSVSALKVEV